MAETVEEKVEEKSIQTRVHEAMEKHGGIRRFAAEELGITLGHIKNLIHECPTLNLRWGKLDMAPPDEIEAMLSKDFTVDEERMAKIIEQEAKRIRSSIESMGLSPAEVDRAVAQQKFGRSMFAELIEIVNAGPILIQKRLETILLRDDARLEQIQYALLNMPLDAENRDFLVAEEKSLSDMLTATSDQLQKWHGRITESSKVAALIKFKLNGSKMKKVKPQFSEIDQGVIET